MIFFKHLPLRHTFLLIRWVKVFSFFKRVTASLLIFSLLAGDLAYAMKGEDEWDEKKGSPSKPEESKKDSDPLPRKKNEKPRRILPHTLLETLLFGDEEDKDEKITETLSFENFFKRVDSYMAPEEKEKLYRELDPLSFGRAFIVSYLIEPLASQLPPLEIHYTATPVRKGIFKFCPYAPSAKDSLFDVLAAHPSSPEDKEVPLRI